MEKIVRTTIIYSYRYIGSFKCIFYRDEFGCRPSLGLPAFGPLAGQFWQPAACASNFLGSPHSPVKIWPLSQKFWQKLAYKCHFFDQSQLLRAEKVVPCFFIKKLASCLIFLKKVKKVVYRPFCYNSGMHSPWRS